jgi:hypothetical protein
MVFEEQTAPPTLDRIVCKIHRRVVLANRIFARRQMPQRIVNLSD